MKDAAREDYVKRVFEFYELACRGDSTEASREECKMKIEKMYISCEYEDVKQAVYALMVDLEMREDYIKTYRH